LPPKIDSVPPQRIPFNIISAPPDATPVQRRNFINVQVDAVGVGLASAAAPFLPVFLARLGASNTEVGLLTAMPGFTGLIIAIAVGRFLQGRKQVVPWFSVARLIVLSSYTATGLAPFIVPREYLVVTILGIWALATIPQTIVNVSFSVVMNAVAGPTGRYDLMSRRWSILGLTNAVTVVIVGQALDRIGFPINYQIVFMALSLGGLISYYYSSHITLPDAEPPPRVTGQSLGARVKGYFDLIRSERPFVLFAAKRFVFLSGSQLAVPLFPLYFVREVNASDAWIGFINTAQSAIMMIGYFIWMRQTRSRGTRFVLISTTFGMSLYPLLTAFTHQVEYIAFYAALAGIFQAGVDLVLFDELMKTIPARYSATFVSLAQSLQNMSSMLAPIVGTMLATYIGLSGALVVAAALRLLGCALFIWGGQGAAEDAVEEIAAADAPEA